jgi:hypothetical protein
VLGNGQSSGVTVIRESVADGRCGVLRPFYVAVGGG